VRHFRPDAFREDMAALRERHRAELLRTLRRHHGAMCEVCNHPAEFAVLELSFGRLPVLTVCRHVLRQIDGPHATAEFGITLVGSMPWD
jgi:hypothetical protein